MMTFDQSIITELHMNIAVSTFRNWAIRKRLFLECLDPDDESSKLRKFSNYLVIDMVCYPRRSESSSVLIQECLSCTDVRLL